MPEHPCKNCGTLIEFWQTPGQVALSCPKCKRVTVIAFTGSPHSTGTASQRPPQPPPPRQTTTSKPRVPRTPHAQKPGQQATGGSILGVVILVVAGLVARELWSNRTPKPAPRRTAEVRAAEATSTDAREAPMQRKPDAASPEPVGASTSFGAVVDRDLAIPENAPLVAWLNTPRPGLMPVTPRWLPLPHWKWEDHSNRVYVENGNEYLSERDPLRFSVRVAVDHALADAIERQFGYPVDAQQPSSWSFGEGGARAPLDRILQEKAREIESAHGYKVTDNMRGPDYEWLIDVSASTCALVAPAVIKSHSGKSVAEATTRQRLEALTSFVQNAIPYRLEVEGEMARRHADGKDRFGIRPPAATLLRGGDCDSKSLLLAALLRSVDRSLPIALVHVKCTGAGRPGPEPHTILGVALPDPLASEQTATVGDRRLTLIETTHGSYDVENPFDFGIGEIADDTDWSDSRVDWIRER